MSALAVPVRLGDHIRGELRAPCSLVEYGDYECPACGQIQPVIQAIRTHFGDRLCFVFRNFPLSDLHPTAQIAAEAAEFAGEHGKFWEMHDLLFTSQDEMSARLVLELAERLGLSQSELIPALQKHTYRSRVHRDFEAGIRSGVNGTPTLFIDAERYDGSFDFASIVDAIDHALSPSKR